ncbi:MAG: type I-C CRISPR-associated endonuclease Cas1c [Methylobacter sp.]|uniref:type I-C CRISPR-associated endonuclease Cas1c n=1 Tax=Methylobacter sp. TaxID=2051955 RepID=UPI00258B7EF6|nr:type I-C CRISPR-associated endonuclease Cas1c [Methylobacter sp.]MCL7419491.1 type I-C CRISPR-associated endonuclease Cas1c [Methylobacter sp.]
MNVFLNTLYITNPDAYLHLEGDTVCVKIEKIKKMQVPIHHLGSLVLVDYVMLSPALLARCAEDGRSIVWLDRSGRFKVRLEGPVNGNILLRQSQYRNADNAGQTLTIARAILAGKLRNSRQVLMRGARESNADNDKQQLVQTCRLIAGQIKKLPTAQSLDTLRGLEGDTARLYFAALPLLMRGNAKENFLFTTRNRRPPRDRFNALISFLYALVLNDCRSALESTGLDPQLGFLHAVRPGRPALALDLLEEFRAPLADRLALTLINRAQIQPGDFVEREGGAVLLGDDGRKTVITAYQERKQETLQHPLLGTATPIGLLPHIQARLLARYLREDVEMYIPYLHK